ncbi:molybdopterin molybdotransferase MoeA [Amnibacterium setariae]|uniref:Molybdopterin molybdenumtransferase n=1 Tax=Amnibacterium setariae TaxID=2306585 RepID=A0A3A1U1G8_9MICO|nr:molybdopterin molybdotransferase MoeA [Amnibacterium setariae]RIX30714.1 molybdopterin molybdenumtransferase MoeA [Amnibacterium setariae]
MTGSRSWSDARAAAAAWSPAAPRTLPLAEAVGAVLAEPATAPRPMPHYDSAAMDGWAVAGPPPWRTTEEEVLVPGQARAVVTGGALPLGASAVVPVERGTLVEGLLDAHPPEPGAHVRRAGEEAPAGTELVAAGARLSPAHVAVLAIAGLDAVVARARPTLGLVLTGDEVVTAGLPAPGRVRDAFDPLLPLAVAGLGATALPPARVGDDPIAIRAAVQGLAQADVVVTVGGTGRSRVDRLREALEGAEPVFDGVAMRPGHPALLTRLPDCRPLLGLPGNPLAAVSALLSFLPPLVDALTGATPAPLPLMPAAVALAGWPGGESLVPCAIGEAGLLPAPGVRPNMLRGLAASAVLAVVPPEGVPAGAPTPVLPLPF